MNLSNFVENAFMEGNRANCEKKVWCIMYYYEHSFPSDVYYNLTVGQISYLKLSLIVCLFAQNSERLSI